MPNLSAQQLATFNHDGYLIVKNFCGFNDVKQLLVSSEIEAVDCHFGNTAKLPWWKQQQEEDLCYLTHSEKVVKSIAQLLNCDSPVCHILTKSIEKKAGNAGAAIWQQDYAYWYTNNLLFPDEVTSFMVALSHFNPSTGSSQVIKGSHKLGRLNHGFGDTAMPLGADQNMVDLALDNMELVNIELEPGDALFFHSNLLHRCQANISNHTTQSIVATYASQRNLSTNDTYAAWHLPIEVISNEVILERQASLHLDTVSVNIESNNFVKELAAIQLLHAS